MASVTEFGSSVCNYTKGELLVHAENRCLLRSDAHQRGFLGLINLGSGLAGASGSSSVNLVPAGTSGGVLWHGVNHLTRDTSNRSKADKGQKNKEVSMNRFRAMVWTSFVAGSLLAFTGSALAGSVYGCHGIPYKNQPLRLTGVRYNNRVKVISPLKHSRNLVWIKTR